MAGGLDGVTRQPVESLTHRRVVNLYGALLHLYPPGFQRQFSEEMVDVFSQALSMAASESSGALWRLILKEFFSLPRLAFREHRHSFKKNPGATGLRVIFSSHGNRSYQDGRGSLSAVFLETLPFAMLGIWLVLEAYFPAVIPAGLKSQRPDLLSPVGVLFVLPLLIAGLLRGLPRWTFPPAGILLGYSFMAARAYHLLPLWFFCLSGGLALAAAAWKVNARWPLPDGVRLLTSKLRQDWTSYSFAAFGLVPLLVHVTFNDGFPRGSSPYPVLAVGLMLVAALTFSRSRIAVLQVSALLVGVSGAVWLVLPHQASHPFPLPPALLSADLAWLGGLWSCILLLVLIPGIFHLALFLLNPKGTSY